jgi:hypothetical protein
MKARFAKLRSKYIIAACLTAYFLWSAWFGLRGRFAPDDMMNLGHVLSLGPDKSCAVAIRRVG